MCCDYKLRTLPNILPLQKKKKIKEKCQTTRHGAKWIISNFSYFIRPGLATDRGKILRLMIIIDNVKKNDLISKLIFQDWVRL